VNLESLPALDLLMTVGVSALALTAVWLPLYKGLRLCLEARSATRRLGPSELRRRVERGGPGPDEPLALLMLRTLLKSLRETEGHPREFVVDATRQYVVHEYESHYARRISMYANLLPPIGFIGTTGGLLILLVSMHLAETSLELGALALALTSSIFALIGFSALEGLKIRLYGRLLACIDEVMVLQQRAETGGRRKAV
jgi:hypothetical protein